MRYAKIAGEEAESEAGGVLSGLATMLFMHEVATYHDEDLTFFILTHHDYDKLVHPLHIRWDPLVRERLQRGIERQHGLAFLAEATDRDRALGGLLAAGHEQSWYLGKRMFADLEVDLLVAQIRAHAQARARCG